MRRTALALVATLMISLAGVHESGLASANLRTVSPLCEVSGAALGSISEPQTLTITKTCRLAYTGKRLITKGTGQGERRTMSTTQGTLFQPRDLTVSLSRGSQVLGYCANANYTFGTVSCSSKTTLFVELPLLTQLTCTATLKARLSFQSALNAVCASIPG